MHTFFDDNVLLGNAHSKEIYRQIKDLPIIDYHCHLDPSAIRADAAFSDIGELWLAGDHYKWRAMRLCGVDEHFITGKADFRDKFIKYAQILPRLAGNPLYYWSHFELRSIFGIEDALNASSAENIYMRANEVLASLSVQGLLRRFRVEYVATTDDPCDDLAAHGTCGQTRVAPTFRPDRLLSLDESYLQKLGDTVGFRITALADCMRAAELRLQYFADRGCRISDHGFLRFPERYISDEEAECLFRRRGKLTAQEKELLFGNMLVRLARLYHRFGMIMQLHFAVTRNVNPQMFDACGADAGFDVIADSCPPERLIAFFRCLRDDERPETVLYSLNDSGLPALACLTGAFRHVRMGAAWWFNDTVEGIRKNLSVIAEYSALGTNFGMLTDSRSFSSYVRFDFFRRILAQYLGGLTERGEYDLSAAVELARGVSYFNIKEALGL